MTKAGSFRDQKSLSNGGESEGRHSANSSEWALEEWGYGERRPYPENLICRSATRAARRKWQRDAELRRRVEESSSSADDSQAKGIQGSTSNGANAGEDKHIFKSNLLKVRGVRPSLIVPDTRYGSDSEAAVLPEHRSTVRNRRRAAVLLLESVADNGCPKPVESHRYFPLGSPYDQSLIPPESEQLIGPTRAPRELLSHTQQGKRVIRPGSLPAPRDSTSRKPRAKGTVERVGQVSRLASPDSGYSNRSALEDVCLCDSPSLLSGSEGDITRNISSSTGANSNVDGHPLVRKRSRITRDDPLCQPEENLFLSFFSKAQDEARARKEQLARESKFTNVGKSTVMAGGNPKMENDPVDFEDGRVSRVGRKRHRDRDEPSEAACAENCPDLSKLDEFSKSVYKGLEYACATKRVRVDEDGQSLIVETSKPPANKSGQKVGFGGFEEHTKSFGSRMLAKMGFTGRGLGAKGQGIKNPLEGNSLLGRSGLGTKVGKRVGANGSKDVAAFIDADNPAGSLERAVSNFRSKEEGLVRPSGKRTGGGRAAGWREDTNNDLFAARRARPSLLQEDDDLTPEPVLSEANEPENTNSVVEEEKGDDIESCTEVVDEGFDNGRRGVLVEFDVLVKGARSRRFQALSNALRDFDGLPEGFEAQKLLAGEASDVSDEQAVRLIIAAAGLQATDGLCDRLLDLVDDAHSALPPPVVDQALLLALKAESQVFHIGILHRGTRKRLNRELRQLNLASTFISTTKAVVDHADVAPYSKSWKDLMCRLGVTARQAMIVLSDQGMSPLPTSALAARILGARSMVYVDSSDAAFASHSFRGAQDICKVIDVDLAVVDSSFDGSNPSLKSSLAELSSPVRFRRVLALYETEGLWYAGRVEYCSQLSGDVGQKVLVRYYKWNNVEWVDRSDTVPLGRADYRLISNAQFPGLLFPDDVAGGLMT